MGNVSMPRQPSKLDFNKLTRGMQYYTNEPYYLNPALFPVPLHQFVK